MEASQGEVGKSSAKGICGFGKGGKGNGIFLGRCFKCGEAGHRKQDCTKVGATDDDIPISDAPTHHAESVWDTGKVDVDGGWQVKKNPQKVSPAWCLCGLDGVQGLHEPREPSCCHTRAHERLQVSGTTWRRRIS